MEGTSPPISPVAIGAHQLKQLLGDWRREGGSAYRALAASVLTLVRASRIPMASRLPSERDLAAVLSVSRTTVTTAYRLLSESGYLTGRRGVGSFVSVPSGGTGESQRHIPGPDEVIDLSVAAMSAPQPWLSRAMAHAVAELSAYAHGGLPSGIGALRRAVADRYSQRGLPTTPEQILITNGATGALTLLLREFTAPGARIAVESPCHPGLLRSLRMNNVQLVPVPLGDNGWAPDAWARAFRATHPLLACLTPDFHPPTGLLMSDEQRHELVALARSAGVTLIADETLVELSLDPTVKLPPPLAAYDAADGHAAVITISSASKAYWDGLRIGWIRATPEVIRRLTNRRLRLDISSPIMGQLVLHRLLTGHSVPDSQPMNVLDFQRTRARTQRDALVAAIRSDFPRWTFHVPDGGLALWVRTDDLPASVVAEAAAKRGVRLITGPHFGTDPSLERLLCFPFTRPPDILQAAVRRVADECAPH